MKISAKLGFVDERHAPVVCVLLLDDDELLPDRMLFWPLNERKNLLRLLLFVAAYFRHRSILDLAREQADTAKLCGNTCFTRCSALFRSAMGSMKNACGMLFALAKFVNDFLPRN